MDAAHTYIGLCGRQYWRKYGFRDMRGASHLATALHESGRVWYIRVLGGVYTCEVVTCMSLADACAIVS